MLTFKAKKLWGGDVSVQSFIVEYAKKMKQKIKVEYQNAYMIIDGETPYKITAPPQIAQRTDNYIKKGMMYQLYDFAWNPQVVEPDGYNEEGLRKLHEAMSKVFKKKDKQLDIIDTGGVVT